MKYQNSKGHTLTPIELADQEYCAMKQNALQATQEDLLTFLKKRDGDPSHEFIQKVQASPETRQTYIADLTKALADEQYTDDFFSLTGKRLDMTAELAKVWAEQTATELFGPPPTLQ